MSDFCDRALAESLEALREHQRETSASARAMVLVLEQFERERNTLAASWSAAVHARIPPFTETRHLQFGAGLTLHLRARLDELRELLSGADRVSHEGAALLAAVRRGELDRLELPRAPLDILAQ
ncbi:MAG: hypothetical protein KDK91_26440, partial [Gammaproteobacteria bacterium]|nr:hypothetical protein [Gammaproteobacteria bacterium]